MKKIGIVTFHNTRNYGACLQAVALQHYLIEQGHDVKIIDYYSNVSKHYRLIPKLRKNVVAYFRQLISSLFGLRKFLVQKRIFNAFFYEYMELTENTFKNVKAIKKANLNMDCYITGSDQVWNAELVGRIDPVYFLEFAENARRISYAASIGGNTINPQHAHKIAMLLDSMDYISVREESAAESLQLLTKNKVNVVVDPVFLMNSIGWDKLFKFDGGLKTEKYIFVYFVVDNPLIISLAKNISETLDVKIISLIDMGLDEEHCRVIDNADPRTFVELIRNAKVVISNSFHATAFSIIYGSPFLVVPHGKYNARLEELLSITGMNERLYFEGKFNVDEFCKSISDKDSFRLDMLQERITFSKDYLKNALQ